MCCQHTTKVDNEVQKQAETLATHIRDRNHELAAIKTWTPNRQESPTTAEQNIARQAPNI